MLTQIYCNEKHVAKKSEPLGNFGLEECDKINDDNDKNLFLFR